MTFCSKCGGIEVDHKCERCLERGRNSQNAGVDPTGRTVPNT